MQGKGEQLKMGDRYRDPAGQPLMGATEHAQFASVQQTPRMAATHGKFGSGEKGQAQARMEFAAEAWKENPVGHPPMGWGMVHAPVAGSMQAPQGLESGPQEEMPGRVKVPAGQAVVETEQEPLRELQH